MSRNAASGSSAAARSRAATRLSCSASSRSSQVSWSEPRTPASALLGELDAPARCARRARRCSSPASARRRARRPAATRACGTARSSARVGDERATCRRAGWRARARPGRTPLGGVGRGAAGEHGQPPERPPLVVEQQVVAPVDRRLAARRGESPAVGCVRRSRAKRSLEAGGDLRDRQRLGPGRGELDGQRQPVEVAAQLDERPAVVGAEQRLHRRGPLDEQRRGVVVAQRAERRTGARPRRRAARGWSSTIRSPGQPRAGGERDTSAAASRTCSQLSRTTTPVAVAEALDGACSSGRRRGARRPAIGPGADAGGDRLGDGGRGRRPAPARRTTPPGRSARRRASLERQPGLADAAGPDEVDQPGRAPARPRAPSSSSARPTNEVSGVGSTACWRRSTPAVIGRGERRVVGQHGPLERLQLRARDRARARRAGTARASR